MTVASIPFSLFALFATHHPIALVTWATLVDTVQDEKRFKALAQELDAETIRSVFLLTLYLHSVDDGRWFCEYGSFQSLNPRSPS